MAQSPNTSHANEVQVTKAAKISSHSHPLAPRGHIPPAGLQSEKPPLTVSFPNLPAEMKMISHGKLPAAAKMNVFSGTHVNIPT